MLPVVPEIEFDVIHYEGEAKATFMTTDGERP